MTVTVTPDLAAWLESSLVKVMSDVDRARGLARSAIGKLFESFTELRLHLGDERKLYEDSVHALTGTGADKGLVGVLRDVLARLVEDITRIGQGSVKILIEVDALRTHAEQVASRGQRIEKIAQTTRVISLNARIEAQRVAGAGAVFRVVADEIKALANESSELSKAIRHAIALQSASLLETKRAASQLSATDLNLAVESHKNLEIAVQRLARVSETSRRALDKIQADVDAAITALQFEDMLDQLLAAVRNKLETLRATCAGERHYELADADIKRDAVSQQDVSAGSVELF